MGGMLTTDEMLKHQVSFYKGLVESTTTVRFQLFAIATPQLNFLFIGSIESNSKCYDSKALRYNKVIDQSTS